jgi:hypothetical protein
MQKTFFGDGRDGGADGAADVRGRPPDTGTSPPAGSEKRNIASLAGKWTIKMAFPQFAELWKLIDLLVRKDFRQANLVRQRFGIKFFQLD